jgi:hypothetical protein
MQPQRQQERIGDKRIPLRKPMGLRCDAKLLLWHPSLGTHTHRHQQKHHPYLSINQSHPEFPVQFELPPEAGDDPELYKSQEIRKSQFAKFDIFLNGLFTKKIQGIWNVGKTSGRLEQCWSATD